MPYKVTLEIITPDEETAFEMFAAYIGVPRKELYNDTVGFSFNGACVPSALTYFMPAHIKIGPIE